MDTGYQSYTWRRNLILRLLKKYLMASAVLLGVLLGFEQLAGAQQASGPGVCGHRGIVLVL